MGTQSFLPTLTTALKEALGEPKLRTEAFVLLCHQVIPVFDHLGTVFLFAKLEFASKNESIEKAAEEFPVLEDLVNADKERGTVTQRGSCSRNLHRLMSAIVFIQTLIKELASSKEISLRDAASAAYETALAPIHTRVVRGMVSAGMLALPSRDAFLESLGETDDSAKRLSNELISLVDDLENAVNALYDGPMPASTNWLVSA